MSYRRRSRSFSYCPSDYQRGDEDRPGSPYYDEYKAMAGELDDLRSKVEGCEDDLAGAREDGDPTEIKEAEQALAAAREELQSVEEELRSAGRHPDDDYDEDPREHWDETEEPGYYDRVADDYEKKMGY